MKHNTFVSFIQAQKAQYCLLLTVWLGGLAGAAGPGRPEVIEYYWKHAAESWAANRAELSGQTYSFTVSAVVQELSRGGHIKSADTSVNRYFFSAGKLDSMVHKSGDTHLTVKIDISVPPIFDFAYLKTFFPNDTGAGDLAIGFDTDSATDPRPSGIVTIDRNAYTLRRLHLAYPDKPGFRRFSRTIHFFECEGMVFPDSIIETAVVERLLADEDYRLVILLSDYKIAPPTPGAQP